MNIMITIKDGDKLDDLVVNTLVEARRHGRSLRLSVTRLPKDTFLTIDIGDCPKALFEEQMKNCGASNGQN